MRAWWQRPSKDAVVHFKSMANEATVPYQSLLNLHLRDRAINHRKVQISWSSDRLDRLVPTDRTGLGRSSMQVGSGLLRCHCCAV